MPKRDDRDSPVAAPDTELDAWFAAARAAPPEPTSDLMARIAGDAFAEQDRRAEQALVPSRPGLVARWVSALRRAEVAGLAAATVAGLWLGIAPPDSVAGVVDTVWSGSAAGDTAFVDPLSAYDLALLEE